MLLVGSFEPFDEEEARRVGANDILTKPFQSIRRLIEKVGLLSRERPAEEQIPTAELRKAEEAPEPVEKLTTAELEITTADTQPLPPELQHVAEHAAEASRLQVEATAVAAAAPVVTPRYEGAGEVLLDLGDFKQGRSVLDDDFVLDIDLEEVPEPSPAEPAFSAAMFRNRESFRSLPKIDPSHVEIYEAAAMVPSSDTVETTDQLVTPQGYERVYDEDDAPPAEVQTATPEVQPAAPASVAPVSVSELSPEMIDAIAKRAVEQLSEKVIQEIAWEVVPQLAELLIKRQLEEKNS
jgi:CheY-like chemotaxis protein